MPSHEMEDAPNSHLEVDKLLANLFGDELPVSGALLASGLSELFKSRLKELGISERTALEILNIQSRTFKGLMHGTLQKVDFSFVASLASFLQLDRSAVFRALMEQAEKADPKQAEADAKRGFIVQNFDLMSLLKIGFIDSISDLDHIEARVKDYFGLASIFDYNKEEVNPAYSSGSRKPKNQLNRTFLIESAVKRIKRINNYYDFDREELKAFIPSIRKYTQDVEKGLYNVTRALFKLGITVHYHERLDSLNARGATFAVNDKPCIILMEHTQFYPSLWFALMHELYHVLYDWDTIRVNKYHVTTDSGESDLFRLNEQAANDFAGRYLLANDKLDRIKPFINDPQMVKDYARSLDIHPGIVYLFYCYQATGSAYGKYSDFIPKSAEAIKALGSNPWQKRKPVREIAQHLKQQLYSNL